MDYFYDWKKLKVKWISMIFMIIFNQKFRHFFKLTILYSLENNEIKKGNYASDVIIFESNFYDKILTNEKGEK